MSHRQTPSHATLLLAASGLALAAGAALAQGPLSEPFLPSYQLSGIAPPIGFQARAAAGGDLAGDAVSSAGDVNGDGVDDMIVGARGNRRSATGDAYVVFGRAGGGFPAGVELGDLDGADGFKLRGFRGGGQMGYAVSGAGDLNGDGVDDVIVGVPTASNGGGYSVGECYVVFGRDAASGGFPAEIQMSGLDGTDGFRIEGFQGVTGVGASLAAAGDVNGDGLDDVLIGGRRSTDPALRAAGRSSSSAAALPRAAHSPPCSRSPRSTARAASG